MFGVRLLELLRGESDIETHLVISKSAGLTLQTETGFAVGEVETLADQVHSPGNIGAPIASGSFRVAGMIVAPCSIRAASAIATGVTDELVSRAADVMLKERRTLVLAVRETPLHAGHLETLLKLARLGAVVFPPVPSFYHRPAGIPDIVDQSCMRMLDQIGIEIAAAPRWGEPDGVEAIGNNGR